MFVKKKNIPKNFVKFKVKQMCKMFFNRIGSWRAVMFSFCLLKRGFSTGAFL